MNSVREIVEALGGPTKFGRICGFLKNPGARGSDILARGSIPIGYWPQIVDYATTKELPIDNDVLVRVHALRDAKRRAGPEVERAA